MKRETKISDSTNSFAYNIDGKTKIALNKNQFTQNEYRAFHTVNGEILPLIIDNKINIDDGIEEIKSEFKKVVKILETENKN